MGNKYEYMNNKVGIKVKRKQRHVLLA